MYIIFLYIIIGCFFYGTKTDVAEHKRDCSFKDESQLLAIAMKEVKFDLYMYVLFEDLVTSCQRDKHACTCNIVIDVVLCDGSTCTPW